MSGPWHPTARARVSSRRPEAQGVCDRCYINYSLRDLRWQYQWAGTQLQNLRLLVCRECLDKPMQQLRSIIIPADPLPVFNPRPEAYDVTQTSLHAEQSSTPSVTFSGDNFVTSGDVELIWEQGNTPLPDPNNPSLYPDE